MGSLGMIEWDVTYGLPRLLVPKSLILHILILEIDSIHVISKPRMHASQYEDSRKPSIICRRYPSHRYPGALSPVSTVDLAVQRYLSSQVIWLPSDLCARVALISDHSNQTPPAIDPPFSRIHSFLSKRPYANLSLRHSISERSKSSSALLSRRVELSWPAWRTGRREGSQASFWHIKIQCLQPFLPFSSSPETPTNSHSPHLFES
ncbi:hypothetical protein PGT21_021535 [Puccinia graminis f. sp. tritici]|uniref:Uncharacterized protein n=1 Tax=Puccinia graminis f. sp. tritici TaxID=56615 RepID=A0A5B0LW37_PUCGR|nr:hypothetical protein PGT21_021535 [Puccinia graminis f. sp. tritici]KAA1091733.1 hypothetical protein PGTUg99_007064 [Puccinia graminis f. sp. tritici]